MTKKISSHVCKIHTIKDGKTVCVYCGKEMFL